MPYTDCANEADIAFIIDVSGSIQRQNFEILMDFIKQLVVEMDLGTGRVRVALVYFSDEPTLHEPLLDRKSVEDILHATDNIPYKAGQTNIADAIALTRNQIFNGLNGDRLNVTNYAILITDGEPNINEEDTVPEAIQARIDGIHVVVVTIGPGLTQGRAYLKLQGIASEPVSENYHNAIEYGDLALLVPGVGASLCNSEYR